MSNQWNKPNYKFIDTLATAQVLSNDRGDIQSKFDNAMAQSVSFDRQNYREDNNRLQEVLSNIEYNFNDLQPDENGYTFDSYNKSVRNRNQNFDIYNRPYQQDFNPELNTKCNNDDIRNPDNNNDEDKKNNDVKNNYDDNIKPKKDKKSSGDKKSETNKNIGIAIIIIIIIIIIIGFGITISSISINSYNRNTNNNIPNYNYDRVF